MALHRLILLTILSCTGLLTFTTAGDAEGILKKPVECLVCGKLHSDADYVVRYKAQEMLLCSQACLDRFRELEQGGKLDPLTAKVEPRSALFQTDSSPKPQMSRTYFVVGLLVLIGLVCGGAASYVAVQKGHGSWSAFALGFVLNVVGLVFVWMKPKREMLFTSSGLTKIPSTRDERACPACGHANHPSARACNACRAPLTPAAPSEVELAGLRKRS